MQNFMRKILMNKAPEGGGGGTPPAPPKPNEQPPNAPNDPPPAKEGDSKHDQFGYEVAPKEDPKEKGAPVKEGDPKKEDPAKEPKKVEPGTGYGDKEPAVEEPPPKEDPKDPPPAPTDLDKKLEGLSEGFTKVVKAQIADLGLDGEKLDKFIALKKQEQKDATDWQKAQEVEFKRQDQLRKQAWHKELKEDPAFGGDKFAINITRSEKVLDEYLPELKKELTDAKQMLRPSVMRGLARLADQLYPDRQVVQGDPPAPEGEKDDDKKGNDPLAFYNS